MVPQHGQGAVGEAARTVMVTSLVIRTCSITRSERSGMMVIGSHWIWKTSRRRTCLVLQYTTCAISGPAEEPGYVSKLQSGSLNYRAVLDGRVKRDNPVRNSF